MNNMIQLPPEILNDENVLPHLIKEFDLKVIKFNGEKILLKNPKNELTVFIELDENKASVSLGTNMTRSSSFFSVSNDRLTNNISYEMIFMLAELLVIDTIWEYNYDKYLYDRSSFPNTNFFYKLLNDNLFELEKLLNGTDITVQDIKDGTYKNAANKYLLLKNLVNKYPNKFLFTLEYLPISIFPYNDLSNDELDIMKNLL